MGRPGAGCIELSVGLPVLEGFPRLFTFFVRQRQIVMRVSVGRRELQSREISFDRLGYTPGFIEHISEIEMGQRVSGIDFYRAPIVIFRSPVVLPVVIERAKVDVGGSVFGIK